VRKVWKSLWFAESWRRLSGKLGGAVQLWTTFAKVEQRRKLALLLSAANHVSQKHFRVENDIFKITHVLLEFYRDAGSPKLIDDGFFWITKIELNFFRKIWNSDSEKSFLSIKIKLLKIRNPMPVKSSDVSSAIAAGCRAFWVFWIVVLIRH